MSRLDKIILSTLFATLGTALTCGTAFGIWQGSWAAGVFMTVFAFIMLKGKS